MGREQRAPSQQPRHPERAERVEGSLSASVRRSITDDSPLPWGISRLARRWLSRSRRRVECATGERAPASVPDTTSCPSLPHRPGYEVVSGTRGEVVRPSSLNGEAGRRSCSPWAFGESHGLQPSPQAGRHGASVPFSQPGCWRGFSPSDTIEEQCLRTGWNPTAFETVFPSALGASILRPGSFLVATTRCVCAQR